MNLTDHLKTYSKDELLPWQRHLPAILNAERAAILISCSKDEILLAAKKGLLPTLGKRKKGMVAKFATVEVLAFGGRPDDLSKMVEGASQINRDKNSRRKGAKPKDDPFFAD